MHPVGLEEFVFEACVVGGVGVISHAIEEPFRDFLRYDCAPFFDRVILDVEIS